MTDIGSFVSVRLKDDDTGANESPRLDKASHIVAWMEMHPDVTNWRVNGTIAANLGSPWRTEGKTMHNYHNNGYTQAQLLEHLWLAGHAKR